MRKVGILRDGLARSGFLISVDPGDVRSDAIFLGDGLLVIDVYFGEGDFVGLGVFRGERLEGGRDDFAGSAPVGVDCSLD
jgi:hypothetical protein